MYSRTTCQGESVHDAVIHRTRSRAFILGSKLLHPLGPKIYCSELGNPCMLNPLQKRETYAMIELANLIVVS
jgi:hypothetical protein